jgi:serine/threonine protein kinase
MLPLADGGSLAELLAGERPSPFESNNDIFISCCGVVSAIRAVHNYFADGVEALGCHRDLKPSNILLDGTKFVLADFGLSRFKQLEEGSASQFKAGRGDYLAPECEDLGEPFEKHVVQRSSDMWSLGCILSEILTLILKGLKGVETFRSRRCFKVGHFKYRLFHCGPQTENPHVWEWFGDLEQEATEHTRTFLSVVKELLVLDPTRRPNISVLDLHLRRLTIEALAGEVATLYCQLYVRYRTTPALVEWYRFWSWSTVVQESKQPIPFLAAKSFEDFAMIIVTLQNLKQDLEATPLEQTKFIRGALLPLRKMNDLLLNALPNHCARRAREHFEASMLESEDPNALEDLSKSLSQNSAVADARLIHLAKVKRLKLLAEETPLHAENRRPPINVATIENAGWLELIYKGWLTQHEGDKQKQSVLVETKSYDEPLVTAEDTCELLARLEAMADLLNEAQSFRVLPCLGFYNDPLTYSLGLVYKCPIAHQTGKTTVSTLHEILERARAERGSKRPSLGDRFKLAHTLALSVLEFHKVGWSQKTISSFNIVFCKPADEHWTAYMTEPSFLGYIASRQDEEGAFTEGPADDERLRRYLCPEYLIDWKRYEQHFDYYGLGLVLLELGLWSTIDGLLPDEEKKQRQPEELRVWLLRKAVPGLGQTMGKIYEKAVDECLRWQLSPFNAPVESSRASNWLRFSETVVEKLASCRA